VPLAGLLVLRYFGVKLPTPLDAGALTAAALLAAVALLTLVDPQFTSRVTTLRDLAQPLKSLTAEPTRK
jgi:hypothetical protein